MFFWKRKKEEKKLTPEQIEKIATEYTDLVKEITGKYLPRRMRRALNRAKGWQGLSLSERKKQIQKITENGVSSWLEETTQETIEQVSSFIQESTTFEEELRKALREFKKKWGIK
ncbi:hypothetical protein J7L81_03610 [Candidatus Aerophobetes bacterium]|uniref:Uncharacterized protein n=1 Tax=Aerophobetes bacterium TaxID=2030807 RepID=A0A7V5I1Z9_UNCAE|nr:hypothetical protein [Candidatus Aerophobetes bacterium]HHF98962.1 hypothetical protein [Candidatus Aerophobetes bacterium]